MVGFLRRLTEKRVGGAASIVEPAGAVVWRRDGTGVRTFGRVKAGNGGVGMR